MFMSGWGGMGLDGISEVSFNLLYTLWVYRLYIYEYLYSPHKFLVGLKFWSRWGPDAKIEKHPLGRIF